MPTPFTFRLAACVLSALAFAAAAPAARAQSPTGGAAYQGDAPQPAAPQQAAPGAPGHTLTVAADVLVGRSVRLTGTVPADMAGRGITIQRFDAALGWAPVASAVAGPDGAFATRWRANHIGRFRLRALAQTDAHDATAATNSNEVGITVYRPATATWYGPGFYGHETACGLKLTRGMLGVAHRRLPCGTQVALHYKDRSVIVPVIDRGPFRHATDWDLTNATAKALGFTYTDDVGALRLRDVAPVATPKQAPPARARRTRAR